MEVLRPLARMSRLIRGIVSSITLPAYIQRQDRAIRGIFCFPGIGEPGQEFGNGDEDSRNHTMEDG
eukprot:scaffold34606_cov192-Amphora_coffeaeformis.AAC.6